MSYNQVNISSGHSINCQGAVDIINEVTEAKKVVDRVYDIIKASGKACYKYHDTSSSSSQNLVNIVNWHNGFKDGIDVYILMPILTQIKLWVQRFVITLNLHWLKKYLKI